MKIRGSAQHIAEKYLQLARDAQASGDRVMAENYMQHAEHYFRLLAAAQAQFAPHLPAYVRPDEQALDDDEDFEEGGDAQAAGQPGEIPMPGQAPQQQPQPGGQGDYQQGQQREFRPRWERDRQDRGDRQDRFGGERGDRGQRGDRFDRRDRQDRGDRPDRQERFQGGGERAEFGEQPSVEFPERRSEGFEPREAREPRGPRPERGPRPDRPPRHERAELEAPQQAANGEAPAEPIPAESEEGREPGLPSFLTRGRRRGRPPYRRREEGEGAEGAEASASADDQPNETTAPPPAVTG